MKKLSLVLLCFSLCYASFSQKPIRFSLDEYRRIQVENIDPSSARSALKSDSLPLKVSAKPDANFGHRMVDIRIDFLPEIDISKVRTIIMNCRPIDEATGMENYFSRYSIAVYFSNKAINQKDRTFKTKLGGLKANTRFKITFNVLLNGAYDTYSIDQNTIIKTNADTKDLSKKLLFVIDKDLEKDAAIDKALDQYMSDAKNTDDFIRFDRVYINDNIQEKWNLYKRIKKEHETVSAPLNYLFFIGSNAYANLEDEFYDSTNVLQERYFSKSINFYTQIYHPEFTYDSVANRLITRRYFYHSFQGYPPEDLGNAVYQSSAFDIAYGSIMPNSGTGKKQAILNYFSKLHDYKTLKLTFNKSVMFADTEYNDGRSPAELAAISTRWKTNDTINVNGKYEYGINNSYSYPQWTEDYLNKLSTKSYEVSVYMGHGSPFSFFFGINHEVIKNLPSMNTMLYDFFSCSVGDFTQNDYLAGAFLEKGNTLFVKAYTVPIGIAVFNRKSPLIELFRKDNVYEAMEKGEYFSDCFLFGSQGLTVKVNFGDPLLKLDPVHIKTQDIASAEVCVGSTIEVPFKLNIKEAIEMDYSVQISDKKGENFVNIPAERIGSSFKITIPENLEAGTNYKLRVVGSNKNIACIPNNPFTINRKPIVEVTRFENKDNFEVVSNRKTGNQWFFEGEKINGATEMVYIPEKVGWYAVQVSEKGCVAMSTNTVFVGIEKPEISTSGKSPACEGDEIKLTGPEGYNQYRWINAKDTIRTTNNQLTVKKSGLYQLSMMRGKIESYLSYPLEVKINAYPPKPVITIESTGLKSSSPTNNQWFLNGTLLKDSTNQYLKGVFAGQYSVKVTVNGCTTESAAFSITSSEPVLDDLSIKLYPNPSEGVFYVEIPTVFKNWQLRIYNSEGKLILTKEQSHKNSNKEEINLKNKKGGYILQVTDGINAKSVKFVVE